MVISNNIAVRRGNNSGTQALLFPSLLMAIGEGIQKIKKLVKGGWLTFQRLNTGNINNRRGNSPYDVGKPSRSIGNRKWHSWCKGNIRWSCTLAQDMVGNASKQKTYQQKYRNPDKLFFHSLF